jgi:hypothetical protein
MNRINNYTKLIDRTSRIQFGSSTELFWIVNVTEDTTDSGLYLYNIHFGCSIYSGVVTVYSPHSNYYLNELKGKHSSLGKNFLDREWTMRWEPIDGLDSPFKEQWNHPIAPYNYVNVDAFFEYIVDQFTQLYTPTPVDTPF